MHFTAERESALKNAGLSDADVARMKTLSSGGGLSDAAAAKLKAGAAFNWTNLIALLDKDAPAALAIIEDVLNAFAPAA